MLGAIGLSIHRPLPRSYLLSAQRGRPRYSSFAQGASLSCARHRGFAWSRVSPAPSDASILTWPAHPTLLVLLSRALRRFLRQLFRWVWVLSPSLSRVRTFLLLVSLVVFCPGLPRPFRRFRRSRQSCTVVFSVAWLTSSLGSLLGFVLLRALCPPPVWSACGGLMVHQIRGPRKRC